MVFDATVAGSSANSYLTVADADDLAAHDEGPEAEAWKAAPDDRKEAALIRATIELATAISSGWRKWSLSQRLLFPRTIDHVSGVPFIDGPLGEATYHQAAYVLLNSRVLDAANSHRYRPGGTDDLAGISGVSQDDGPAMISARALMFMKRYTKVQSGRGSRSVRMATGYVR